VTDLDEFVDFMDRYLEVSNVYNQRIVQFLREDPPDNSATGRAMRLIGLLESVEVTDQPKAVLKTIAVDQALGQSVAPTEEVLEETRHYQKIVRDRIKRGSAVIRSPRNRSAFEHTLKLPPEQFLACFRSVSYAWDILVELASISVLPDPETLAARDMIYMHCAELEVHLAKIVLQAGLTKGDLDVNLAGSLSVKELNDLQQKNELVAKLLEISSPQSSSKLLEIARTIVDGNVPFGEELDRETEAVLKLLDGKQRHFPDLLDHGCKMKQAQDDAATLVSFGLRIGYCVWYSVSANDLSARNSLRKNLLFCVRILIDEGRWRVGRDVSQLALILGRHDNISSNSADPLAGTYMIRANNFLCRKELGEDIRDEVEAWDTSAIHIRYEFLKFILLERYAEASLLARQLLKPEEATGTPNMCKEEFKEWPILAGFRETAEYRDLLET
jgi:hypothetical protein